MVIPAVSQASIQGVNGQAKNETWAAENMYSVYRLLDWFEVGKRMEDENECFDLKWTAALAQEDLQGSWTRTRPGGQANGGPDGACD